MQSVLEDSDVHEHPFPIKNPEVISNLLVSVSENTVRPPSPVLLAQASPPMACEQYQRIETESK